jgi:hypothetical protein
MQIYKAADVSVETNRPVDLVMETTPALANVTG